MSWQTSRTFSTLPPWQREIAGVGGVGRLVLIVAGVAGAARVR